MKTLLLSLFLALTLSQNRAFAAELPPLESPPEPCAGLNCTPRMQEIAARFKAGTGFTESELPFLASGECFHHSPDLNPEIAHYGLELLDPNNGSVYMGGSFGFFYKENPYKNWTLDVARKAEADLYNPKHLVQFGKDFVYSNMNYGGEEIWKYWLKRQDNRAYLIGQWGHHHFIFCELDKQ